MNGGMNTMWELDPGAYHKVLHAQTPLLLLSRSCGEGGAFCLEVEVLSLWLILMAVAMEAVAWRELGVKKKRAAWGADAPEFMQMMMGQLRPSGGAELSTLDLLGACSSSGVAHLQSLAPEFLELDPEELLPSGWEKRLDLQTGKVSFVNKSSGVSTLSDPRKRPQLAAHEFLGSKRSEETSLMRASSSSSSGMSRKHSFLDQSEESTVLELDLNLAAGGASFLSRVGARPEQQTVCTMEMIQNALKRTAASPALKSTLLQQQSKLSASPSFSSLTNSARSDPVDNCSPSTSSSSSISSRSRRPASRQSTWACEGDSEVELVMGACTRCLMYVMLKRVDPRCPRCESVVPVDFSAAAAAPPCKRQRVVSDRRQRRSEIE